MEILGNSMAEDSKDVLMLTRYLDQRSASRSGNFWLAGVSDFGASVPVRYPIDSTRIWISASIHIPVYNRDSYTLNTTWLSISKWYISSTWIIQAGTKHNHSAAKRQTCKYSNTHRFSCRAKGQPTSVDNNLNLITRSGVPSVYIVSSSPTATIFKLLWQCLIKHSYEYERSCGMLASWWYLVHSRYTRGHPGNPMIEKGWS